MEEIIERIKENRFAQMVLLLVIIVIIFSFWQITKFLTKSQKSSLPCYNQKITIVSPFSQSSFEGLIKQLQAHCLKLTIQNKPLSYIKENLLKDIAKGEVPDIVLVDNDFLKENLNIFESYQGNKLSLNVYPESILRSMNNQLRAYPLYFDVLVMFSNKDYLNNAGLPEPPKTFEKINALISQMQILENEDKFKIASLALGTSMNIDNFYEIFLTIHKNLNETNYQTPEAFYETLDFYTQYANRTSPLYSWNEMLVNSLNAFTQGKVAMIFGFYSQKERIKELNPRLNLTISEFPKFAHSLRKTNYIKIYYFAVPKAGNSKFAWMVLEFFDDHYKKFIEKETLLPVKSKFLEDLPADFREIADDLLIGDTFDEFERTYVERSLISDVSNWLTANKEEVKKIIRNEQIYKFFKRK